VYLKINRLYTVALAPSWYKTRANKATELGIEALVLTPLYTQIQYPLDENSSLSLYLMTLNPTPSLAPLRF